MERGRGDEKPVRLTPGVGKVAKKKSSGLRCIVHYPHKTDTKVTPLTENSFQKIKQCVALRRSQEDVNLKLSNICDQVPEDYLPHIYGYHRWCYQCFTNTSRLLKRKERSEEDLATSSKRKRVSASGSTTLLPANECLFCGKDRIVKKGKEEVLIKCVTKTAEESIKQSAEQKGDEYILGKVQHIDLVAKEAHYHSSCRKDYTRSKDRYGTVLSVDQTCVEEQAAHADAFEKLASYVEDSITERGNVERMTMLTERYQQFMQENSPQFYNKDYRTHKLKLKLQKKFGNKLQYWLPNYRGELVYSSVLPKGTAVGSAFEAAASESKRLEEAALVLRRLIRDAHNQSPTMPWPPSARFLLSGTISPPEILQDFLARVITGKPLAQAASSKECKAKSLAADICQVTCGGRWLMPKQLLLGMTLRHLTGSAEVITLVHRFGHCSSYTCLLELETAMCINISARDTLLPTTIRPDQNVVTHMCWDNFDLREETPSGAGTTHTTHGIVIQEVTESGGDAADPPSSDSQSSSLRTGQRSVSYKPPEIEPCFAKSKAEPCLTPSVSETSSKESANARQSDILWVCSRALHKDGPQTVPPWAGWVSVTSGDQHNIPLTTVEYMPPVFTPITDNDTVQHILKLSKKVSEEVGQHYTIVTFDLAAAKKAYAIVWQNEKEFGDMIIRLGVFHTTCAYMCALGKTLKGSGVRRDLGPIWHLCQWIHPAGHGR